MAYNTLSMDLPPSIESLLNMPTPVVSDQALGAIPTGVGATSPVAQTMDFRSQTSSYEDGGMIPPSGQAMPPAGLQMHQPSAPPSPAVMGNQVRQCMAQNPDLVARIRAGIEAGLQAGELNLEDLNLVIQLTKAVMQNPALWAQARQAIIQRGIATEDEIPMEYDEGLVTAIMIAAEALEADVQFEGQPMQTAPGQPAMQSLKPGGMIKGPSHEQGGVPMKVAGKWTAEAEGGEYMIPKHIVHLKGREFFDKMLESYKDKA